MSIRTALVTGSANGIGRAIALRLAQDGFQLAINDLASQEARLRELQHEIELKGKRCVVLLADVSSEDDVANMVQNTVQMLGGLDVMIANAGIILVKSLLEISASEWDRIQAINVRGVFLCYKHAGLEMIKQGRGGKIIGACSISGYRPVRCEKLTTVQSPQTPAYSVSKWAIRGLTQVAAMDLARHGITVNAYCPGMVRTDMWETIDSSLATQMGIPKGVVFEKAVASRIASKRAQTPDDISGLVNFLAEKPRLRIEVHVIKPKALLLVCQCESARGRKDGRSEVRSMMWPNRAPSAEPSGPRSPLPSPPQLAPLGPQFPSRQPESNHHRSRIISLARCISPHSKVSSCEHTWRPGSRGRKMGTTYTVPYSKFLYLSRTVLLSSPTSVNVAMNESRTRARLVCTRCHERKPLGPSPSSRFVITHGGYTSCIITSPEASAPISTSWVQASPEEIARVARTMTAYCGPYQAWEENNETFFATSVEISLNPEWIGGEQVRRWAVRKELGRVLLTLRPVQEFELPNGMKLLAKLEWEKIAECNIRSANL
ncbi:hypothetical protein G7Y89_g206 [Cudoniella acicularis]|uniref:Lipocalin-like domain-containing protein n=1 Tax=Cudoniella acicularis TaxID=354080 RepID=A0A8H4RZL5_9HELO|nr:hypothetical protein G7Y89_g206 [Cudoniella acicularis]